MFKTILCPRYLIDILPHRRTLFHFPLPKGRHMFATDDLLRLVSSPRDGAFVMLVQARVSAVGVVKLRDLSAADLRMLNVEDAETYLRRWDQIGDPDHAAVPSSMDPMVLRVEIRYALAEWCLAV